MRGRPFLALQLDYAARSVERTAALSTELRGPASIVPMVVFALRVSGKSPDQVTKFPPSKGCRSGGRKIESAAPCELLGVQGDTCVTVKSAARPPTAERD